jgi:tetratricopeptide (TPR) repeat protein
VVANGHVTVPPPDEESANAVRAAEQATRASLTPPLGRLSSQPPLHGRTELIKRLWAAVFDPAEQRVHLLHGLSGSGKTSVALTVADSADKHREEHIDVWWVKADDALTLEEHMRALSRRVGVAESPLEHPAEELWKALNSRRDGRWLLVIDNADNHELLAAGNGPLRDGLGWLRPCRNERGTVLVLSRFLDEEAPVGWWQPHHVGRLDPRSAVEALADHIDIGDESEAARRLADRLGGLPLALRLAGSYLAKAREKVQSDHGPPMTIERYLNEVEAGALRLEEPPRSRAARHYIDRPWSISVESLEHSDQPLALPLLRLLAHLASAPIPIGDLVSAAALDRLGLAGDELMDALRTLQGLALIEGDVGPDARLALHPLVRDTTRRRFPPSEADIAALVDLVRHCRPLRHQPDETPSPDDAIVWPMWILLTPHIMRVIDLLLDHPRQQPAAVVRDACFAANYAARSIQALGLYASADEALARIERLALRELGPEDFETLRCRHTRAIVVHATGRIAEAYTAYDAIYRQCADVVGADHPYTVRCRHYRALTLHALGHHQEAMSEYEAVLRDRIRIAGREHRLTLATMHNIARLLHDTGRHEDAERRYRQLLADQSRVMGPDFRHTLATRHNLALCLHALGRLGEAEAEYRQVLDIEERLLGRKHPDTLATWANLLLLQSAAGRGDDARLDEVYRLQCEALGKDHPETIATRDRVTDRSTRPGPL